MSTLTFRKYLFTVFIIASMFAIMAVLTVRWYNSGQYLHPFIGNILILVAMLAVDVSLLIAVGIVGIALFLRKNKSVPFLNNAAGLGINLLFPLALQVGGLLGIDKDAIKRSFIAINNRLVEMKDLRITPRELLVLAPRCLQFHDCPHKITEEIQNCKRCGQCQIAEFLNFRDKYDINMAVVTGGTQARKLLIEYNPKAVIAIACERDLTSGIMDSYPMPVFGILNQRPNGPCEDTSVEMSDVLSSVFKFTGS